MQKTGNAQPAQLFPNLPKFVRMDRMQNKLRFTNMKYSTEVERVFKDIMTTEYTVPDDHKGVNIRGMHDFCGLITYNFRAEKIDAEKRQILQLFADTCTKKKEPVTFTMPIGGYKNWHLSSAPEAGWAELFNMAFMKDLALKITAFHKPGVRIIYLSPDCSGFGLRFNNFPKECLENYHVSLIKIIDYFNKIYGDKKISFTLEKLPERIHKDTFIKCFEMNVREAENFWKDEANSNSVDAIEKKASKHYYPGKKPVTEKDIRVCAQMGWAFVRTFFELGCIDSKTEIPIILRGGASRYLYLMSNYNSVIQFWVGEGVIIDRGDKMYPTILSVNGLKKNRLECEYPTDRFAFLGKNFKYINIMSLV